MKYAYLDSACDVLVPEAVAIQDPGIDYMEYHDDRDRRVRATP
jgi:hypothetical protein